MEMQTRKLTKFPKPDNIFYALFYTLNPKTWTFYGPWGTCASRQEYWYCLLGLILMGLSSILLVGPIIFLVFALWLSSMHRDIPSTIFTKVVTALFGGFGILASVVWLGYSLTTIVEGGGYSRDFLQLYSLLIFVYSVFFSIGFSYLLSRRAHDAGVQGIWWVIVFISIGVVFWLLMSMIPHSHYSYYDYYGNVKHRSQVALLILESILGLGFLSMLVVLGLLPSKSAQEGNPFLQADHGAQNDIWSFNALLINFSSFQPGKDAELLGELYAPVQRQAPWQQAPQPQGQAPWQQAPQPQGQAPWQQSPQPQGQAPWQQAPQPQGQAPWQQAPQPQGQAPWQQAPQPQGQAPWQQPVQPQGQATPVQPNTVSQSPAEPVKPVVEEQTASPAQQAEAEEKPAVPPAEKT